MKIIVVGIGQSLRGDDAAGLEAVRRWKAEYPETASTVQVEVRELPGLSLLDLLEGMDAALLVDAFEGTVHGGKVLQLQGEELEAFTLESQSAHGWGVAETLQLGSLIHPWIREMRVILIGIGGLQFTMGMGLSPEVEKALPEAAQMIQNVIVGLEKTL